MKTAQSDYARRHLRDLLNEIVRDGEHFTILRYQAPEAVLVPHDWYQSVQAILRSAGRTAEWASARGGALNLSVNQDGNKIIFGNAVRTGEDPFTET
jgi:PHD/YefM family antitoxin component YafN of YafNO toxin-antitoxin module